MLEWTGPRPRRPPVRTGRRGAALHCGRHAPRLLWARAGRAPLEEQRALFHELVVRPHPELFVRAVVGRTAGTGAFSLDDRLREWLPGLPGLIPAMRRLSAEIGTNLERYDRSFRAALPELAWRGRVYFTVSLDAFDGTVRPVQGRDALIFGVDKIARIHGQQASLEPLFHHELFHLYHDQVMRPPRDDRTPSHLPENRFVQLRRPDRLPVGARKPATWRSKRR